MFNGRRLTTALLAALSVVQVHCSDAAATRPVDFCALVSGAKYALPATALACLKSFPFNETLRQNVLTNVDRVFNFYNFEEFYLNSPPPFQESTVDIRKALAKINSTHYHTDYDFNMALYNFVTQLNDGHTRWFPNCYTTFQNLLPAPIVSLSENGVESVFIVPDLVELVTLLGPDYAKVLEKLKFNWKRLAGARVLAIEGQDPRSYIDFVARTVSGNYLDHGVRVNSVYSSYRISGTSFSQRFGDLAGTIGVAQTHLTFKLIAANSTKPEIVSIPYVASIGGNPFEDKASFWANNCVANEATNGHDLKSTVDFTRKKKQPMGSIIDKSQNSAVGLPSEYIPTLPTQPGSEGVIKSYILPDNKTGVMFVGSFEPDNFYGFQLDTVAAVDSFLAANVSRVIIDLTNNGGGYVCLGLFLHQYFAGSNMTYGGFESVNRANPLAQKILAGSIAFGLDSTISFYSGDNWAFLNDTQMPKDFNYNNPTVPLVVNGKSNPTSQRFHETCQSTYIMTIPAEPPFPLNNVGIVGNGNCASTCALFSTLMHERHNTKVAMFGGKPGQKMEYKGMAGNQVLEWVDLDNEIKTAGVKDDPLAPPDLLVSGNFRHNWRTAYSYLDKSLPIAYVSELPLLHFPYTKDTYNNPQNLWTFAAGQLFK
ncbi:hypothetical protein BDN72DRAFT_448111 [Pluteus cervinus]|uniref:Uncharacterized protein n=1 Tax=Pluteus cervinus TaxID=181527 RepID=A0ACD3BDH3_9AGAR|nr:hypothetical protein BDN72DRAFT_448111 [Pluteus cervinus]